MKPVRKDYICKLFLRCFAKLPKGIRVNRPWLVREAHDKWDPPLHMYVAVESILNTWIKADANSPNGTFGMGRGPRYGGVFIRADVSPPVGDDNAVAA